MFTICVSILVLFCSNLCASAGTVNVSLLQWHFFWLKWSTIQYGKMKSNYVLKNAENWTGFTLQTIYLVDILIFLDDVFIMMYIYIVWAKLPKTSFPAPDRKVKVFFITWLFDWIQVLILHKMSPWLGKLELGF